MLLFFLGVSMYDNMLDRNIDIYNKIEKGEKLELVAKEYNLSEVRVYNICAKLRNRFDVFSLKYPWFHISLTRAAMELNLPIKMVDKIYNRLSMSILDDMLSDSDDHSLEYWLDYARKYYYGFGNKSLLLTERALQLYFEDGSKTIEITNRWQEKIKERLDQIDTALSDLENRRKKLCDERNQLVLEYKKNLRGVTNAKS